MVPDFQICNAVANGLNDASAFMPKNNWEGALWVCSTARVFIGVTDACVEDLHSDLV
jgi:hypothetical protein